MTQHVIVTLATDLTWEQFLARLRPTPVKSNAVVCQDGRTLRTVQLVPRRFACGELRLIGTEPISDRWYYLE